MTDASVNLSGAFYVQSASGVAVVLGSHIFEVAPAIRKNYSAKIAIIEIPDGTDQTQYMGRTNKEITMDALELSKATLDDLVTAYGAESDLVMDIPDFEESGVVRINGLDYKEVSAVAERQYYQATITVVMTT